MAMKRGLFLMLVGVAGLILGVALVGPRPAYAQFLGPCSTPISGPCWCSQDTNSPFHWKFCTGFQFAQSQCMNSSGGCTPVGRQCYGDTSTTWTDCFSDSSCLSGCLDSGVKKCMLGDTTCCGPDCGKGPG